MSIAKRLAEALSPKQRRDYALGKRVSNEVFRDMVRQTTKEGRRIAKTIKSGPVPRESGLLKKSLGARSWRKKAAWVCGIVIGARSGFAAKVFWNAKVGGYRLQGSGKGKNRDPVHYLHMVEFGTSHSRPKPFMKARFESEADAALNNIMGVMKKVV